MKRATTLKENYEFRRVYNKGKSGVSPFLVVYARPNRGARSRLGVTVSAKLGHAVARNRVRRRLREIYRLAQPRLKQGYDVVLVARGRAMRCSYQELEQAFARCCERLKLWREDV
ncbi:MAG: ribonuclease P protein component [Oscillospiraceae bacterium]|nr:ribonuclease P protein component [Oscillospiraceae bacterium]